MTTEKQTAANRANSKHSTGPTSPEGKQASAQNALRHGMTARKYLRRDEDPAEFEGLLAALRESYQPTDDFEEDVVAKLAMCHLRQSRALGAEAEHGPLSNWLLGDHDDRVRNLASYETMIRKTQKQLDQMLTDHRARKASRAKSQAASPASTGSTVLANDQNQKTKPISTARSTSSEIAPVSKPKDAVNKEPTLPTTAAPAEVAPLITALPGPPVPARQPVPPPALGPRYTIDAPRG